MEPSVKLLTRCLILNSFKSKLVFISPSLSHHTRTDYRDFSRLYSYRRSGPIWESFSFDVDFSTSFEKVQALTFLRF